MLYTCKPFSIEKELGKVYNAHCAMVPNEDDWILIMDTDTMLIEPSVTYPVIFKAIEAHPDTTIFGAMTNRVGIPSQRVFADQDPNPDIIDHYKMTLALAERYRNGECKQVRFVGGFFLLFRKRYWMRHKFQAEIRTDKKRLFDYAFCEPAMRSAAKIRVILGAYVFHYYRMHKDYRDKSHLL